MSTINCFVGSTTDQLMAAWNADDIRHETCAASCSTSDGNTASEHLVPSAMPCSTPNQRFETAMSILGPMASVLSQLSAEEFPSAVSWLGKLEKLAKTGEWRQQLPDRSQSGDCTSSDDAVDAVSPTPGPGIDADETDVEMVCFSNTVE